MSLPEEQFVARVKNNSKAELSQRKPLPIPQWKAALLQGLGWFLVVVGIVLTLAFFGVMESVHSQLGGLANPELANSFQSSPAIQEIVRTIGIDWFPQFMRVYEIRQWIILGLVGVFAALSFASFSAASYQRKKS